jgi:hypothetical protein
MANTRIAIQVANEVKFQQHGYPCRMWIPLEKAVSVLKKLFILSANNAFFHLAKLQFNRAIDKNRLASVGHRVSLYNQDLNPIKKIGNWKTDSTVLYP